MADILHKPNELIGNKLVTQISQEEKTILKKMSYLSTVQRKIHNMFLKNAQQKLRYENHQSNIFEINGSYIYNKIKSKDHSFIKKEILKIMHIVVEVRSKENKNDWSAFHILESVEKKGEKYIYKLDEKICKALKVNGSIYTVLDLDETDDLFSQHALTLFELAVRYKKHKIPKMTIQDLREITGTVGRYKKFPDFRKNVLDKPIEEIDKKLKIKIKYILTRGSRSYTHIDFEKTLFPEKYFVDEKPSISVEEVKSKLKKVCKKISVERALKLFNQHKKKDFEFLLYCLKKTEENAGKSVIGYFNKIVSLKSVEEEYQEYQELERKREELKKKSAEREKAIKEEMEKMQESKNKVDDIKTNVWKKLMAKGLKPASPEHRVFGKIETIEALEEFLIKFDIKLDQ